MKIVRAVLGMGLIAIAGLFSVDGAEQDVPATPRKFIRVARVYPHSFQYSTGERFFPMGDTAYFLLAQPTNVIARYLETRRMHRFNFVRMMPMAPGHWPFGGTPQQPDYANIDESAMRKLDWVFDQAEARGMNIELIVFGYGIEQGEGLWADETARNRWIDALVRRHGNRSNLFMWTVANEFERYPDGRYEFAPGDVEWAKAVAARIRRNDTVHPIGCHPSVWITDQDTAGRRPFASYRGFSQRRPQVVWPLWNESAVDLNITQNNEGVQPRSWDDISPGQRGLTYYATTWEGIEYPVRWTEAGWDFEAAGMEDAIAADWWRGKPVLNTEFGYQFEVGADLSHGAQTRQFTTPSTVRKKAWKIATTGGYFAAGFRNVAVAREFSLRDVEQFRPEHLDVLYDFFTFRTEFWRLEPHLELVAPENALLALPGREYVAYFPRGGRNAVTLDAGSYSVHWLHAESGRYTASPSITVTNGPCEFVPPGQLSADWLLHLRLNTNELAAWRRPTELPVQSTFPNPLVMLDGRKVETREMWFEERRPELRRLFQHYMYGWLPPRPELSARIERTDTAAFNGRATLSEVTLMFRAPDAPPIHLMLVVPNGRTKPAPVMLALNYFGNHTLVYDPQVRLPDTWMPGWGGEAATLARVVGNRATDAGRGSWAKFWPIEDLLERGYALATFYNGDMDPDSPEHRGLQQFFRHANPEDDCGSIAAWAWGLQRAVDYLVTAPGIDARRIVVTGHSRTAKAALLAAAMDDRIAMAIPHQAGCGGSAPSRARISIGKGYNTLDTSQTKPPETVFDLNDKFPHWFNARFKEFNRDAERLPFDQDCLVALCAPRPVLFTNGRADTWINPAGQFEVLRGAAPVYRLLGAGGFAADELPPDGKVIGHELGYYLRPGGHSLTREDWRVFLDFADQHLGRP